MNLKISSPTRTENCRRYFSCRYDVALKMLTNLNKMLVNLGQSDPCVTVEESIYAIKIFNAKFHLYKMWQYASVASTEGNLSWNYYQEKKIWFCINHWANKAFFLIGIYSMQVWTATTRHGVTRKRSTKKIKAYRKSV